MSGNNNTCKTRKFTKQEDEIMVKFIKENILWNARSKDFKNTVKKDQKWKELSSLLGGKDVKLLKGRWKNIRDYEKKKTQNAPKKSTRSYHVYDDNVLMENVEFDYNDYVNVTLKEECPTQSSTLESFSESSQQQTKIELDLYRETSPFLPNSPQKKEEKCVVSSGLKKILQELLQQSKRGNTVNDLYFEIYRLEMEQIPTELQSECQQELHAAAMAIFNKYKKRAREAK